MRTIRISAALAALSLAAMGCGGDDDTAASTAAAIATTVPATNPATDSTTTPSTGAAASGTRTVEHARGEIELPAAVDRVVALDPFSVQNLYDLGVEPIGVQSDLEAVIADEFQDEYAAAAHVGGYGEPNIELIATLDPQVVFMTTYQWDNGGADLAGDLPVVVVPGETSAEWPLAVPILAAAMDREAAYDELVAAYEARVDEIATAYADELADLRWGMAWLGGDGTFRMRGPTSNSGQALADIGAVFVDTAPTEETDQEVSFEELALLTDADIIALPGTTDGTPDEGAQAILDQPLFAQLPAAQADGVVLFEHFLPSCYGNSMSFLDEVEEVLQAHAG